MVTHTHWLSLSTSLTMTMIAGTSPFCTHRVCFTVVSLVTIVTVTFSYLCVCVCTYTYRQEREREKEERERERERERDEFSGHSY